MFLMATRELRSREGANPHGGNLKIFDVAQPRFPDPIRHASELEFVALLEAQQGMHAQRAETR